MVSLYNNCRSLWLSLPSGGDRVECPFCQRDFRKLLPYGLDAPVFIEKHIVGGGYRLNAQCPRCYSLDRERFLYLFLRDRGILFDKNKASGWRVLHFAPESNLQKILESCVHLDYINADMNSPKAMTRMDMTCIGFQDNTFNIIICAHVLEHISDDIKAMSELYRVLKPGGWAVLQTPISLALEKTYEDSRINEPKEREKAFGQFDHLRIYARDFKDRLKNAGFQVEAFHYDENTIKKYGLFPGDDLFICGK